MMEPQHGRHTVRSHGLKLARVHLHDWLILLLLGGIEFTLFITHPFYRFVGREMMDGLKYPRKNISIRFWVVPIFAVVFPILVFAAFYFRRRDIYDLHHSILGILFSVLITGVLTDGLKDVVGEPRPDFFWRCFPDGNDVYDRFGGAICHGKESDIKDGHKSFPSGHTSWSFAGLGFLSLYLSGKIKAFDRRGHVAKLCIVILPLLVASYVGISVVNDYYHHWRDVIGGGLLGLIVTIICYLQFFPPPYHSNGWGPWAYFQMLEGLRCFSTLPADGTSVVDIEVTQEVLAVQPQENEQNEIENNGLAGFSRGNNEASQIEDIECGRK